MDVPLQMIHRDQRQPGGEGQGLGVGNADQQRAGQARAAGYGDGVQIGESHAGLGQCGTDHGNNGAQMLAAR
jgi:hypothetical protein